MNEAPQRSGWLRRMLGAGEPPTATPSLPPGTRVERDVPYGRWPAQRLDIYRGAHDGPGPVMVVVHGGAWMLGDKANAAVVTHKVAHWVPQGWVVVSVNYRLLPRAHPLEQADDLAQALAAVQTHVARWGGDQQRLVVVGHSTGAHLAALVLADPAIGAPFGLQPLQGGVLLDSAALDVVQVMEGPHLPLHDRAFGSDPAYWRAASPWHRLQAAPAPMLLVSSAQRPDSVLQAEHFAARVQALGGSAQLLRVALPHRAINEQLGQPGEMTDVVDGFLQSLPGLGGAGVSPQRAG